MRSDRRIWPAVKAPKKKYRNPVMQFTFDAPRLDVASVDARRLDVASV
jgi:hypothetical protein